MQRRFRRLARAEIGVAEQLFQVGAKNCCDELRTVVCVVLLHEVVQDSEVAATDPEACRYPRFRSARCCAFALREQFALSPTLRGLLRCDEVVQLVNIRFNRIKNELRESGVLLVGGTSQFITHRNGSCEAYASRHVYLVTGFDRWSDRSRRARGNRRGLFRLAHVDALSWASMLPIRVRISWVSST